MQAGILTCLFSLLQPCIYKPTMLQACCSSIRIHLLSKTVLTVHLYLFCLLDASCASLVSYLVGLFTCYSWRGKIGDDMQIMILVRPLPRIA